MNAPRSGFLDHFALWASLCAGLYLMPFGALLVPALSIERAVLATVIAGLLAGLLIAAVAGVAARTGRSSAELLAEPFGASAATPVALALLARHLLFAVFALALILDSAELISDRSLGAGLRPFWALIFATAGVGLAVAGPEAMSKVMRRAGIWLVLLVAVAVAASAYMEFEIPAYLKRPAAGGWPSFWQATDIMLIFPLLWLPVVADFARFGRDSRSAVRGTFAGVFVASVWFGVLGILYLPATDSGDIPGFLVGMQLGLGALVILFLLQGDELVFSTAASQPALEALGFGSRSRFLPGIVVVAAAPAALFLNVADLEGYVVLVAASFIPAFALVIAHSFVPARTGLAVPVGAWVLGFALYQWITPAEIGWWQDGLDEVFAYAGLPFPLSAEVTWLGAALPAFLATLAVQLIGSLLSGALQPRAATAAEAG